MTVVDVHAHVLLPALDALVAELDPGGAAAARALDVRRNGEASQAASRAMIGERFDRLTVLARRLADMDATGVDVQIVSPSPSHYYPFLGAEHARLVADRADRAVRELVDAAPDRLHGLGLVPLQHPDLMVELLETAVVTWGLLGVEMSSFGQGPGGSRAVDLSDPRLEPFWARAAELGAPLFVHPFGCTLDERLDRFYLANTVGQPTETAVALSHLIFAGVLDRHPSLVVVAAHGGGYLPTAIGRSDHAWRTRPEAHACAEPPSRYLRRIYVDSLVHSAEQLRSLVATVGADRVLLGSDYPFDMGDDSPVASVRSAGLGTDVAAAVLGENAARLGLTSQVATAGGRPS